MTTSQPSSSRCQLAGRSPVPAPRRATARWPAPAEHDDLMAVAVKRAGEHRPDLSGSAGNDDLHRTLRFRPPRRHAAFESASDPKDPLAPTRLLVLILMNMFTKNVKPRRARPAAGPDRPGRRGEGPPVRHGDPVDRGTRLRSDHASRYREARRASASACSIAISRASRPSSSPCTTSCPPITRGGPRKCRPDDGATVSCSR